MIIAGNWKMHKTIEEAIEFIERLIPKVKSAKNQIFLAPPFTALAASAQAAKDSNIFIGAQNMSDVDEGAYTGEISAKMIKNAGAEFVILGHSERRTLFQETSNWINRKLKKAFIEKLRPILCIGESEEEREKGKSLDVLKKQLDDSLSNLSDYSPLIVAYEPVWAIGTGQVATAEIVEQTHAAIRTHLGKKDIPILYGGSVKPNNITSLLKQSNVDGALIGGASLDVEAFANMVLS